MPLSFVLGVFMRLNNFPRTTVFTHEGARSSPVPPLQQLRRLSMACMLWEDTFYVDGKTASEQIEETCKRVKPDKIVDLAIEAHEKGLLRHLPLFLLTQAAKQQGNLREAIDRICTRPDQMTELLSIYWKEGKKPIPSQIKRGLAAAFTKFDEYQLAKYNRDTPIKLRDILFLCHPKPKNKEQDELWKRLISNTLHIPETWETKLSSGADKKESFEELLMRGKMGKLAIVRNLRNMEAANVPKELVEREMMRKGRPILPFQFLAAARMCPRWEDIIDRAMIAAVEGKSKLPGVTVLFVDVSGSMDDKLSIKSEMTRLDAACGIAILLKEVCENVDIFTFSNNVALIPNRKGMGLRDAILHSQPHGGTYLGAALQSFENQRRKEVKIDRIIVITDEQTHDTPYNVTADHHYILNIGTYRNGILNSGQWLTITGFSEACVDYILEIEKDVSLR
jgi:TROVE domain-containing protein/VWA domain-containing protein